MKYDPNKPAQLSIHYNGRRHYIQDGVKFAYQPPHEPLDPEEVAAREREIEAQRLAASPRVSLMSGEELIAIDEGRGIYMITGGAVERGPYRRDAVAHLLAGKSADVAPVERLAGDLALREGERLEERGNGWYVVIAADGQQMGPARRTKDVAHLLPGDAA